MAVGYTREEFVKKYGSFIANVTKGTPILPGTLIAQAILESQGKVDGKYRVGASKLARKANNYFGIKCGSWKGAKYNIDTGEYSESGEYYISPQACFRSYRSVEDSIVDYLKILTTVKRYRDAGVLEAKTVREQADAIRKAGYATSPRYADTVVSVYNSVKEYINEYVKVSLLGGFKAFAQNPRVYTKLNWKKMLLLGVGLTSITVGTILIVKHYKNKD